MIKHYPYKQLGQADHGWLKARYHFSFASYINRDRMGFGTLRVINDDIINANNGFDTHPHDNMEIITYVREGAITHQDSLGNKGRTGEGDVQVMSAGSGVAHSEHNLEPTATMLYQIWITPRQKNIAPRWEARRFPKDFVREGPLPLLVSGREEDKTKGALFIHQDAFIYGGRLKAGTTIVQSIKHQAYVLASMGSFALNDVQMQQGDGAEVTKEKSVTITAATDVEILVIDAP